MARAGFDSLTSCFCAKWYSYHYSTSRLPERVPGLVIDLSCHIIISHFESMYTYISYSSLQRHPTKIIKQSSRVVKYYTISTTCALCLLVYNLEDQRHTKLFMTMYKYYIHWITHRIKFSYFYRLAGCSPSSQGEHTLNL